MIVMKPIFERMCDKCVNVEGIDWENGLHISLEERNGERLCNVCRYLLDNPMKEEYLKSQWLDIVRDLKQSRKGKYEALFAFSGGRDSAVALHIATKIHGLNLLAFTIDNGFKTPEVFKNLLNVVNYLNVDWFLVKDDFTDLFKPLIKDFKVPCGETCNQRMDYWYHRIAQMTRLKTILTGGDLPFTAKGMISKQSGDVLLVRSLAPHKLSEEELNSYIRKLPWKNPDFGELDSDCWLPLVAVKRFYLRNKNAPPPVLIESLASRVSYGIVSREKAIDIIKRMPQAEIPKAVCNSFQQKFGVEDIW